MTDSGYSDELWEFRSGNNVSSAFHPISQALVSLRARYYGQVSIGSSRGESPGSTQRCNLQIRLVYGSACVVTSTISHCWNVRSQYRRAEQIVRENAGFTRNRYLRAELGNLFSMWAKYMKLHRARYSLTFHEETEASANLKSPAGVVTVQ